tara:strand:+ start:130 stop:993 length:864 start_codon:yes stop_codon:yes gene_type:complete
MKKLLLASASVLTLISACTKEVEVADRAGILQKFSGSEDEVQDIGIERLTTTFGGQTIVANVMREGISEELPAGFIEGAVGAFAAVAEAMITGGDTTQIGEGMGAFITEDSAMITSDSDADDIFGAIYTQGSGEDMVGVAIMPGINEEAIMVFAAGTEVSAMPATGEFNYEGANFAIEFSEGDDLADEHIGSFMADVNFGTGEGSIGLDFENELLSIDGDFTVDTATGIFVGDKLEMKSIGIFDTATIHGNFHGVGATGMTGIYTNNIADPNFIGAIAGTQVLDVVD